MDISKLMEKWRVGMKLGRTVYSQHGTDPCVKDEYLGIFDTVETASLVCKVMNEWFASGNSRATRAPSAG